jgi:hypothetical protein
MSRFRPVASMAVLAGAVSSLVLLILAPTADALPSGYSVTVDESGTTTSGGSGGSGSLQGSGQGNVNYGFAQECAPSQDGGPFSIGNYPPATCAALGRPYSSTGSPEQPSGFWFTGNQTCVNAGRPFSGSTFTWHVQLPQTGAWHVEMYVPTWTSYGFGNQYILNSDDGQFQNTGLTQQAYHGQWVHLFDSHTFTAGHDYTVTLTLADTADGNCHYQMADEMRWVYDGASTGSPPSASKPILCSPGGSLLFGNQILCPNQQLTSPNGRFRLVMQGDGNLVLYKRTKRLWQTHTNGNPGAQAAMQADGNFVVYSSSARPLWQARTYGNPGAYLAVKNDGSVVIYFRGHALWSQEAGLLFKRPTTIHQTLHPGAPPGTQTLILPPPTTLILPPPTTRPPAQPPKHSTGNTPQTRTFTFCLTQTMAITDVKVYQVCETATDSYDGKHITGGVIATGCNIYFPINYCGVSRHGSYWNASLHAWEDWVNYVIEAPVASILSFESPEHVAAEDEVHCVFLRIDTQLDSKHHLSPSGRGSISPLETADQCGVGAPVAL